MSEFTVDLSDLSRERPVGVTGLMRVRNEERFLARSVESCIEALDELIIVWQQSDDRTGEIVESMQARYPDKIRAFFYAPQVISHNLSAEQMKYVSELPADSPHLLANYYNYTLSKATYRYALKIDADQIYFSEKLRELCDAYRADGGPRPRIMERIAGMYLWIFSRAVDTCPWLLKRWLTPSPRQVARYQKYVLKSIARHKWRVSLSGVNLYRRGEEWVVPLGNFSEGTLGPINGVHDSLLFEISSQTYFIATGLSSPYGKYGNCMIEKFLPECSSSDRRLLYGGLMWYHMEPFRQPEPRDTAPLFEPVDYIELERRLHGQMRKWMRAWYCMFWNYEQSRLTEPRI